MGSKPNTMYKWPREKAQMLKLYLPFLQDINEENDLLLMWKTYYSLQQDDTRSEWKHAQITEYIA